MSSLLTRLFVLKTLIIPYTYAQSGVGSLECARECIDYYFTTDIGANCTKQQGGPEHYPDWACACTESNFLQAFPCCLQQTCTRFERLQLPHSEHNYEDLCREALSGEDLTIDLYKCESKDLYYNPVADDFAGTATSLSSTSMPTTGAATSTTSTSETSAATTQANGATDTADGQEQEDDSSSNNGGDNMGLGLGVGLGVGIPLLVVGLALVYFLFWRAKRKEKSPSEESGDANKLPDNGESTFVGSEDASKSRTMSELPVSPSMGSPYAPSELPSSWARDSSVVHEMPAEEKGRPVS